jgi:WD40 repeat protein
MTISKRRYALLITAALLLISVLGLHAQDELTPCRVEPSEVRDLDWHPDGQSIAISSNCGVGIFDSELSQIIDFYTIDDFSSIHTLAFNHDGSLLAASLITRRNGDIFDSTSSITIWEVSTKEIVRVFNNIASSLPLAWHPSQNLLIVGYSTMLLLDVDAGEILFSFVSPLTDTTNTTFFVDYTGLACWSPQGSYFRAFFSLSGYVITVPYWEITYVGHGAIQGASCNPSVTRLATLEGEVSDFVTVLSDYERLCDGASVAWSPDSKKFAVNCRDNTVRVYDQDATLITELESDFSQPGGLWYSRSIAYNPDGLRLVALGNNGYARLWDTETYELLTRVNIAELANSAMSDQ